MGIRSVINGASLNMSFPQLDIERRNMLYLILSCFVIHLCLLFLTLSQIKHAGLSCQSYQCQRQNFNIILQEDYRKLQYTLALEGNKQSLFILVTERSCIDKSLNK